MKERSRARGWALQALYAWEARGEDRDTLIIAFEEMADHLRISTRNRLYAEVLLRLIANNLPGIDRTIQRHLTNWSLPRLSVIDRNILRVGVAELLYVDDVPPRVTIREMMHLAERYATPESPRFVNGVLDAVMRTLGPADDGNLASAPGEEATDRVRPSAPPGEGSSTKRPPSDRR